MLNFGERFLEEDIELMIRLADLDDNGHTPKFIE